MGRRDRQWWWDSASYRRSDGKETAECYLGYFAEWRCEKLQVWTRGEAPHIRSIRWESPSSLVRYRLCDGCIREKVLQQDQRSSRKLPKDSYLRTLQTLQSLQLILRWVANIRYALRIIIFPRKTQMRCEKTRYRALLVDSSQQYHKTSWLIGSNFQHVWYWHKLSNSTS